ncbi:site-specific integrase [Gilvimarinus sp. SDUM040013]|uniref:Site-specific integrase n=1 Tax=Gilvimarinus gilvus TaxID=3058038 RepID=A0ABU4RY86_9GAMM|nr:site-specific integrase [Gilvimarinus sp. SDUM040013]MDO3386173.1 site-specific integrase [Gilvimarinus sp. SDUM040013]MDX6849832.1 site-specific integrase [Gilvimarinus sp. SDUM040013]
MNKQNEEYVGADASQYFKSDSDNGIQISSAGFEFNTSHHRWVLDSETTVHVDVVWSYPNEYQENILATLEHFAITTSAKYVVSHTVQLRRFLKHGKGFTLTGLMAYKKSFPERSGNQAVSTFRTFMRRMVQMGFHVPDEFMREFNDWVIGGGERGVPVSSQDPEEGPYSDLEFRAIQSALDYKYADGTLSDREYSLVKLFMATFRRPANLKQLKIQDLIANSNILATRQMIFKINIPRSKSKGRKFRSQSTAFALVESIGLVLTKHIQSSIQEAESKIGRKFSKEEAKELPMFFNQRLIDELCEQDNNNVIDYLKSEIPHLNTDELTKELQRIVDKLEIISERTGALLTTTAYRFRYTGGTRAAQAKAGAITIGKLLDHDGTEHVKVYVANSPELGQQISSIMNNPLARYASAFKGEIVEDEEDAFKVNPDATRIPCADKGCDVGSCGSRSFCTDYAPIACYLCPKFLPWKGAPHHEVLQWLLEERKRLSETLNDAKVVQINDSAILAVAQVMKACEEERKKGV